LLSAAVPLLALTRLPLSDNIGAVTVGAVQHVDDHCASLSGGVSVPLIAVSIIAHQHL
jgi:hypothetical protein